MSLDWPELKFAIKPCRREMANPKVVSWRALQKVARYLEGVERVVWKYGWQGEVSHSGAFSDSDWRET
eukprot:8829415-Karenia_brevis.AAC.1